MDIVFHCAPQAIHQCEHARWFAEGLKRHGLSLRIHEDPGERADLHIVSGPYYARKNWLRHPRVIAIDRAYYHEEKTGTWRSMDWVSVGWLRPDDGRRFGIGSGRPSPVCKDRKSEGGTIFLADYDGPIEGADTVRLHPSKEKPKEPLVDVLSRHRVAIGYRTTALVTAALEGLEVVCKDNRNIVSEPNWLELLPYADWHNTEISAGDTWEHLIEFLD